MYLTKQFSNLSDIYLFLMLLHIMFINFGGKQYLGFYKEIYHLLKYENGKNISLPAHS